MIEKLLIIVGDYLDYTDSFGHVDSPLGKIFDKSKWTGQVCLKSLYHEGTFKEE